MDRETTRKFLQSFRLFQDLTEDEMEPIVDLTKSRPFKAGTHVFMQDDPLTDVYFIQEGNIKIYRTDVNGKQQIVNMLKPGDMFPHQGFFREDNYPAHAEAMEKSVLLYIPIHDFENLLVIHPQICIKLIRVLGGLIVDLQSRLEEKIMHTTTEQIIKLLLRLSQSHGQKRDDGLIRLSTPFTNQDLANMIGTSRETVSRTMTILRKDHMVENDKTGHILINFEDLHAKIIV